MGYETNPRATNFSHLLQEIALDQSAHVRVQGRLKPWRPARFGRDFLAGLQWFAVGPALEHVFDVAVAVLALPSRS